MCWEKFNQYFEVEGRYVPVEVDYPVMSVDRIEEYADENTIGEPLVRFSVSCAQRAVFSRCCAQQSCAVSSTESVRQHHRLFWPDSNHSPVHLCSSAGVFVSTVLVDADHVCMCICNVSQVLTGTQPCVAMLGLCPDC